MQCLHREVGRFYFNLGFVSFRGRNTIQGSSNVYVNFYNGHNRIFFKYAIMYRITIMSVLVRATIMFLRIWNKRLVIIVVDRKSLCMVKAC